MTSYLTGILEGTYPAARNQALEHVAPRLEPVPGPAVSLLAGVLDALVVMAAFVSAFLLRDSVVVSSRLPHVVMVGALATAATLVVFGLRGLYDPRLLCRGWVQLARLGQAWLVAGALVILGVFLVKAEDPLRSRLALGLFLTTGFLITAGIRAGLFRLVLRRWRGRSLRGARVVVGTGPLARRLAEAGEQEGFNQPELIGFVDDEEPLAAASHAERARKQELGAPFLGGVDLTRDLAHERRITGVLVAREDLSRGNLVRLAHGWMEDGLQVTLASSAFEVMVGRASGGFLGGVPLVELRPSPQRGLRLAFKRLMDVACVLMGGILALPVLAVIALAVKMTSTGPVLYRQERVGRSGHRFIMYKFRSMVVDGDDAHHRRYVKDLMSGNGAVTTEDGQKIYKLVDDPRITPLGAFLRRTSLDELPQLWNVLRGDMSLVGPRPCLPYEWELYEDWQRRRLDALPGITGLWQVTGRSRVTFEDMVLLDLHYIANWSLGEDIALLARTVPVVLGGTGGH